MSDKQKFFNSKKFKKYIKENPDSANPVVVRKHYIAEEIKQDEDPKSRVLHFTISTDSVDRDNDTIDPKGFQLDNFRKAPVVLFAHDNRRPPIARAIDIGVKDGKLKASAEFMDNDVDTSGFSDMIFRMLKGGFLHSTSVGFIPIEFDFVDEEKAEEDGRPGGVDFKKQELLEFSIVPVPANPEALIEARSKGIDTGPLEEWLEDTLENWAQVKDLTIVPRKTIQDLYDMAKGLKKPKVHNLSNVKQDELLQKNLQKFKEQALDNLIEKLYTGETVKVTKEDLDLIKERLHSKEYVTMYKEVEDGLLEVTLFKDHGIIVELEEKDEEKEEKDEEKEEILIIDFAGDEIVDNGDKDEQKETLDDKGGHEDHDDDEEDEDDDKGDDEEDEDEKSSYEDDKAFELLVQGVVMEYIPHIAKFAKQVIAGEKGIKAEGFNGIQDDKDHAEDEPFDVQILIFPKSKWLSFEEAAEWAKDNGFTTNDKDETESSFRFRQQDAGKFKRLRTVCIEPDNVSAGDETCEVQAMGGPIKDVDLEHTSQVQDIVNISKALPYSLEITVDGSSYKFEAPTMKEVVEMQDLLFGDESAMVNEDETDIDEIEVDFDLEEKVNIKETGTEDEFDEDQVQDIVKDMIPGVLPDIIKQVLSDEISKIKGQVPTNKKFIRKSL